MELAQLEAVEAVARLGTMTGAARELRMSQPALSRSIARLERELGCELFERSRTGARPTAAGLVAAGRAREALGAVSRMRAELTGPGGAPSRALAVATVDPAPAWRLAEIAGDMLLNPRVMDGEAAVRAVESGAADLAVCAARPESPRLRSAELTRERLYAYVPEGHEVAAAPSVRFADLDGLAFLASSAARFWLARVRSQCPRSEIAEFDDPGILARSLEPAGALSFVVGDDGRPPRTAGGYAAVPVEGDAAAATFHLVAREGAQGPAEELMRRVAGARGR